MLRRWKAAKAQAAGTFESPTAAEPAPTRKASPSGLVKFKPEVKELQGHSGPLVMLHALDGFLDAGNAAVRAANYLIESVDNAPVIASFDIDEFHDYRARRPAVTFARDRYDDYETPRLVVRVLHDIGGTPFLLLHGFEPDNRWEAYARGVREVVEHFKVSTVINLGSVPMAIPHTRPMTVTQHSNNPDLISTENHFQGEMRVPASAQALVEVRLGEWGHDAMGFVAHIPHYLAQLEYPAAAVSLLEKIEFAGRLTIDLGDLKAESQARTTEIATYLDNNAEVADVVAALERQYDAFVAAEEAGVNLLAPDQPLPTGDELGQEFERFLAELEERPDKGPDGEDESTP